MIEFSFVADLNMKTYFITGRKNESLAWQVGLQENGCDNHIVNNPSLNNNSSKPQPNGTKSLPALGEGGGGGGGVMMASLHRFLRQRSVPTEPEPSPGQELTHSASLKMPAAEVEPHNSLAGEKVSPNTRPHPCVFRYFCSLVRL